MSDDFEHRAKELRDRILWRVTTETCVNPIELPPVTRSIVLALCRAIVEAHDSAINAAADAAPPRIAEPRGS